MPNGDDRNWKRLCFSLQGFKLRFGHWPSRVRVFRGALIDLRDHILSVNDFAEVQRKVTLVADDDAGFIAEDDAGNAINYGQEGPIGGRQFKPEEWLGVSPQREAPRAAPYEESFGSRLTAAHKALLARLELDDVEARRAAAAALRASADDDAPVDEIYAPVPLLKEAMWDEDRESADLAARALLARSWKFKSTAGLVSVIERALETDDAASWREARNLLRYAATLHASPDAAAPALVPLLVANLRRARSDEERLELLELLSAHGVHDSDRATVVRELASLLEAVSESAILCRLLSQLARLAVAGNAREHATQATEFLDHADDFVAFYAAWAVTALAVRRDEPDTETIADLMSHERFAVREGAAERLCHEILTTSKATEQLIGLLSAGLTDTAGGVTYAAGKTLRSAAEAGVSMASAEADLRSVVQSGPYSREQWTTGPLDMRDSSELRGEWLGIDASVALAYHYFQEDRIDGIAELLDAAPEGFDPERWLPRQEVLELLRTWLEHCPDPNKAKRLRALL